MKPQFQPSPGTVCDHEHIDGVRIYSAGTPPIGNDLRLRRSVAEGDGSRFITFLSSGALGGVALADPPARVGRIAYVEGDVSFQPPQQDEWTSAVLNFPMTLGEAFWTGDDGRVELQVGPIAASLDNETQVDVAALRYGEMRLALSQGSISLRIRGAPVGGVTVSTPAGDIRMPRWGFYRIDVGAPRDDDGYTLTLGGSGN